MVVVPVFSQYVRSNIGNENDEGEEEREEGQRRKSSLSERSEFLKREERPPRATPMPSISVQRNAPISHDSCLDFIDNCQQFRENIVGYLEMKNAEIVGTLGSIEKRKAFQRRELAEIQGKIEAIKNNQEKLDGTIKMYSDIQANLQRRIEIIVGLVYSKKPTLSIAEEEYFKELQELSSGLAVMEQRTSNLKAKMDELGDDEAAQQKRKQETEKLQREREEEEERSREEEAISEQYVANISQQQSNIQYARQKLEEIQEQMHHLQI